MAKIYRSLLLTLLGLAMVAGCGSSNSYGGGLSPQTANPVPVNAQATLRATVDFQSSSRLERFPDSAVNLVGLVFTPTGLILATQNITRTPGSGSVTFTFAGLPAGTVVVRVLALDATDSVLGYEDLSTTLVAGQSVALTFDTLTPGAPPTGPESSSPSPSPASASPAASPSPGPSALASPGPPASASPSPAALASPSPAALASPSPAALASPSPAPAASTLPSPGSGSGGGPSPAASPNGRSLVSLMIVANLPVAGALPLNVGAGANLKLIASFADGSQADVTGQAQWSSSASSLVVVLQPGLIQAVTPGVATITAQLGSIQASLQVTAFVLPSGGSGTPAPPAPTGPTFFIADQRGHQIFRLPPGGPASVFATGFPLPTGLAFDAARNLYVADEALGTVSKITPGGAVTTFASGFSQPWGLAFDQAGNLYVANFGGTTVSKVTVGGIVSLFASGFSQPVGLAFDSLGNLYVANSGGTTVSQVTPGGIVTPFASGLAGPFGLAIDASNNVFAISGSNGDITRVTAGGSQSLFAAGSSFNGDTYAVCDSAGNLYVTNHNIGTVSLVTPAGAVSTFATSLGFPNGITF